MVFSGDRIVIQAPHFTLALAGLGAKSFLYSVRNDSEGLVLAVFNE
jgi:hypothetical protein